MMIIEYDTSVMDTEEVSPDRGTCDLPPIAHVMAVSQALQQFLPTADGCR
jgi:hypothetical protein